MSKIIEELKEYFDKTDPKQLQKDWDEIKEFNEIGPTVEEYEKEIRKTKNTNS